MVDFAILTVEDAPPVWSMEGSVVWSVVGSAQILSPEVTQAYPDFAVSAGPWVPLVEVSGDPGFSLSLTPSYIQNL